MDPAAGPAASLVGTAGQPVELTLRPAGAEGAGSDRRVVVVPVESEEGLRYQDWVRSRAAYVARALRRAGWATCTCRT